MIRLQYILIPCRGAKVFSLAWLLACAESFTCRCYSRNLVPWGRGCYSRSWLVLYVPEWKSGSKQANYANGTNANDFVILAKVREWGPKHPYNQYPTPSLRPTRSRWKTFNNDLNQVVVSSGFNENKGLGHGLGAQSLGLIKPGIGGSYWRVFVKDMAKHETKLVRGYLPLAWKGSCFSFEGREEQREKKGRKKCKRTREP